MLPMPSRTFGDCALDLTCEFLEKPLLVVPNLPVLVAAGLDSVSISLAVESPPGTPPAVLAVRCKSSAVLATSAFRPVPNNALTLPSLGFGNSCSTSADLRKNLVCGDDISFARPLEYLMLIASRPDSKKAESRVEQVGIDQLRNQVIDLLHGDLVVDRDGKELGVRVFKDQLDLYAKRQDQHRHQEGVVHLLLTCILRVKLGQDRTNRNE